MEIRVDVGPLRDPIDPQVAGDAHHGRGGASPMGGRDARGSTWSHLLGQAHSEIAGGGVVP